MQKSIFLEKIDKNIIGNIRITGSKSESNRLLILQALYPKKISIKNISNSDDTKIMQKAIISNNNIIDIHHAGTAMRFLTAYFSTKINYKVIITGSQRMKERPIKILVEALKSLGANINYLEKEGYPPIKIIGKNIIGGEIKMNAQISSQYISALMLIAPCLEKGLNIYLTGNITSYPYILMTYNILKKIGIKVLWNNNKISIFYSYPKNKNNFYIESDWTSASYYYSLAAVSNKYNITLSKYKKNSLQGDKLISEIYKIYFGVETVFNNEEIILKKKLNHILPQNININLNKNPDIAQTISVTCSILKIKCYLYGLETLKIKETDRLSALQKELYKIGVNVIIDDKSIEIKNFHSKINNNICIKTYNDHRMAMSFSPVSLFFPIKIENPNVVTKSYPNFWLDLENLNFSIKYI